MAKAVAAMEASACGSFLQTTAGAAMSKPLVIVEMSDVDHVSLYGQGHCRDRGQCWWQCPPDDRWQNHEQVFGDRGDE